MVRDENFEKMIELFFIKNYKLEKIAIVLNIPLFKIEYWSTTEHFHRIRKEFTNIPGNYSLWLDDLLVREMNQRLHNKKKVKNYKLRKAS